MRSLRRILFVADRTAVLFVGLAVGAVIASSFGSGEGGPAVVGVAEASIPATPAPTPARVRAEAVAPRLADAVGQGRTIRIGVFGDSFGEGVWAGLYNQLRGDSRFEIRQLAERSTGFTRYRSLDVLEDVRAKLDRQPVDIAILSFGANDTQGIFHEGHGNPFMSEGWQRIVSARMAAIIGLLRERGVAIYWVGLPRMRDPGFDADIQAINRFHASRMAALGVPYVDTVPLTVDERGQYLPYLPAEPGRRERRMARANDGIHMTIPGYIHLTRGLADRLRAALARAEAQASAAAPAGAETQG